ncbi:MAG TPA: DnaJ domain-containing protein [Kofleriaceae bacterium]|nr:DnaJ domain-containing protein [Kofleriaceae bacterium]
MAQPQDDPYALLGVEAHASDAELRRAWRRRAFEHHPDRAGPDAAATFKRISAAYELLSDRAARAAHDRARGTPSTPPEPRPVSRPTPVAMIRRVSMTMQQLLACGIARHAEDDIIELLLTASEAETGGHITIPMRVPVRDPATGAISEELYSAWLAIRPGVSHGAILVPSAYLPHMVRPVSFRVVLDW